MADILLRPEEAAARLAISVKQLRHLTSEGQLRWIDIGAGAKRPSRRYTEADLAAFIEERARKCRSISDLVPKPIPMTSSSEIVDFQAILEKLRSEKRKGSRKK